MTELQSLSSAALWIAAGATAQYAFTKSQRAQEPDRGIMSAVRPETSIREDTARRENGIIASYYSILSTLAIVAAALLGIDLTVVVHPWAQYVIYSGLVLSAAMMAWNVWHQKRRVKFARAWGKRVEYAVSAKLMSKDEQDRAFAKKYPREAKLLDRVAVKQPPQEIELPDPGASMRQ